MSIKQQLKAKIIQIKGVVPNSEAEKFWQQFIGNVYTISKTIEENDWICGEGVKKVTNYYLDMTKELPKIKKFYGVIKQSKNIRFTIEEIEIIDPRFKSYEDNHIKNSQI